jgi:hypothetical protein
LKTLERCVIQCVDSEKEVKETIIRKENIDLIRKKITLL